MRRNRAIYALLSIGLIGGFFGHGMWAVGGKDSFVELFTGTFDTVFGMTVSAATATTWVQAIGWFDLAVTAVLIVMFLGNLGAKGALYELAYSKVAFVVYAWGALWGFLTAGARVTAAGELYPELWDVVERAPNFMIPAVLIYLVYQHRLDHRAEALTAKDITATSR